ncbi:DNA polymerase-3 subunit alpha (Gram-positive type) [Bacillus horti]|uniref:DNA polymerase III PolC-type n=1 Tax=Caldalkalibacillus horti TaxID=77523 RepID=A0ABT9VUP9_9BACI|nr:DNA polymerase-3 subunit alpha (Gram-positive type) [Bacillus horti]
MSKERLTKHERFKMLVEQVSIPQENMDMLDQAYIDKLQVDRQQKVWTFYLVIPRIVPHTLYQLLCAKIDESFQHIAQVYVNVAFADPCDKSELFQEYWPLFVEQNKTQLNGLYRRLQEKPPVWHKDGISFTLQNEFETNIIKNKIEPLVGQFFSQFTEWNVKVSFELEESDTAFQQFVEARDKEDKNRAEQALKEMVEAEAKQPAKQPAHGGGGYGGGGQGNYQRRARNRDASSDVLVGYRIKEEPVPIKQIQEEERRICMQGTIFNIDLRELRSGRTLLTFHITDYTDSICVKMFSRDKEDVPIFESLKKGMWVKVQGSVQMDTFLRDLVLMANDINLITVKQREDQSEVKRVELHTHSNMSAMDAITPVGDLVAQAAKWGHPAIAITDHGVAQAFPEAYSASKKHGIKVIYGIEANLVDDGVPMVYMPQPRELIDETYVVFDVETTGLSAVYNKIIELAGVKIRRGEVIERFERFVNPHEPITELITQLTGITDEMVKDAPELVDVLHDFKEFIGDHTLVAHNASFDMGFIHMGYKQLDIEINNPVLDTLELARFLFPEMRNHRLNTLCKKFSIELLNHHRAVYDAEATGYLLWKLIIATNEREITRLDQLNEHKGENDFHRLRPSHCILLVQNQQGLRNLYKLISLSHIQYFHRTPRIPRSLLQEYREGIIVGSGCDKGEVFEGMMQKSPEEVEKIAEFYDYLEIQPVGNYSHLIARELVKNEAHIQEILANIVELGKKLNKPVVATGNVHYIEPIEKVYRKILITTLGGASPLNPEQLPDTHFRTTDEMLEEFQFLGPELANEVVISATHHIQEQIEQVKPIPDDLYTPKIEGAEDEIRNMSYSKAKSIYGDPLPEIVEKRLEKELNSIIGHGFSVIYLISSKLVKKSLADGYLVGSRGSVGSSLVATFTDITEVNPLPPHYVCTSCHYHEFFDDGSVASGYDLPVKNCPSCGEVLFKDGQDIPFETFLGFKGDKVPDIDLNFSGEYQPIAHKYTQELFGTDYVYRAGTIGTVADKTAFGFVKKYEEETSSTFRSAEILRLASGCTGVKRTTGQHPGGIIVVPSEYEIYDFCPIQFPADDVDSEWRTTHFDFHSIHDNLLKLDILGHDDPTVIRMLQDLSGKDPKSIPLDDPKVMSIFSSTEALGVTSEQIMSVTGSLGIPEFGTRFVRQMLEDTKPTTFAELVQISGLSHGTDVWLNNAQELIRQEIAPLSQVISTRDDIMVYLIHKGLDPSKAFTIMEKVRKGKGLEEDDIQYMKQFDVPDWYIDSCQKIKYMFPKAHAAAYVLMAVRISYFKVYEPILFYASYFTVRADDFDVSLAVKGSSAVRKRIEEINEKGNDALPKEKSLLTVLELCLEMLERGLHFKKVDLYRSHSTQFIVDGDGLIPPFNAIPGVGTNAAINIEKAREGGEFLSKEDLQSRCKITKTVLEYLDEQGCLTGLPESNQLSLF